MNSATYPLAAGMINQINRLDIISNNLANANTTGFKQVGLSEGSFNNYLQKAQENNSVINKESLVSNTIPKIDEQYISSAVGPIQTTGNALDFALQGQETFFKVQKEDGEIMFTRDGSFKTSNNNLLVDSNGNHVLNNDNEPITTEGNFISQIAVVKTNFQNLDKFGDNYYRDINENQIETLDDNDGFLIQGALEKSNVNTVSTMIGLIEANKSFAQYQKAISGIDEMNRKLIEKLGRMV